MVMLFISISALRQLSTTNTAGLSSTVTFSVRCAWVSKKCKGYIKKIRKDGKIDLGLIKTGYAKVDDLAERILQTMKQHQGYLPLSDKSSPEQIVKILNMSKGNFKKSIGQLYRKQLIEIE
jgi:predicted RNA-binding protein (virulence factor B family)